MFLIFYVDYAQSPTWLFDLSEVKPMDYDVPSVDEILEEGLNDNEMGGAYDVARGISRKWDNLEVFDDRALEVVKEGIEYLQKLQSTMEKLLDENGRYNWSDHKEV